MLEWQKMKWNRIIDNYNESLDFKGFTVPIKPMSIAAIELKVLHGAVRGAYPLMLVYIPAESKYVAGYDAQYYPNNTRGSYIFHTKEEVLDAVIPSTKDRIAIMLEKVR